MRLDSSSEDASQEKTENGSAGAVLQEGIALLSYRNKKKGQYK